MMAMRGKEVGVLCLWVGLAFGEAIAQTSGRLFEDILNGGIEELSLSLASGTPPDSVVDLPDFDTQVSLLELAVVAKNDQAVALLLTVGARTDTLEGKFGAASVLEVFAQQGMLESLRAYIDQDTTALVTEGADALIAGIAAGESQAATILLERMSNVVDSNQLNASLEEALIFAARHNDSAATKLLLDHGAGANSVDLPLVAAVANCSPDSMRELVGSYTDKSLPAYEGEHVAVFARRCFSMGIDEEDAAKRFAEIARQLYEVDNSICSQIRTAQLDEVTGVSVALENADICQ